MRHASPAASGRSRTEDQLRRRLIAVRQFVSLALTTMLRERHMTLETASMKRVALAAESAFTAEAAHMSMPWEDDGSLGQASRCVSVSVCVSVCLCVCVCVRVCVCACVFAGGFPQSAHCKPCVEVCFA